MFTPPLTLEPQIQLCAKYTHSCECAHMGITFNHNAFLMTPNFRIVLNQTWALICRRFQSFLSHLWGLCGNAVSFKLFLLDQSAPQLQEISFVVFLFSLPRQTLFLSHSPSSAFLSSGTLSVHISNLLNWVIAFIEESSWDKILHRPANSLSYVNETVIHQKTINNDFSSITCAHGRSNVREIYFKLSDSPHMITREQKEQK